MKILFRRTLLPLVTASLLLAMIAIASAVGLAGQAYAGPPPEFPAAPVQASASTAGVETAAYLPILRAEARPSPWLDIQNRAASKEFYLENYGPEHVPIEWTGDIESCDPGGTSSTYVAAILTRINYFRTMAGLPLISGFDAEYSWNAQAAALMMSANSRLSHSPDTDWKCYNDAGREGAGSSNLFLGMSGASAITGYIKDPGASNYPVGHRRWILYPQTQVMGVGNIPSEDGFLRSNALWVFDKENMWGVRPETSDSFVAWPPPGYVPYMLAFARWSFSYPGADFKDATMIMMKDGFPINSQVHEVKNGYGENTLVWEPATNTQETPSQDAVYFVLIENVVVEGQARGFDYEVILFDPTK
jgi:hypothetical protein